MIYLLAQLIRLKKLRIHERMILGRQTKYLFCETFANTGVRGTGGYVTAQEVALRAEMKSSVYEDLSTVLLCPGRS